MVYTRLIQNTHTAGSNNNRPIIHEERTETVRKKTQNGFSIVAILIASVVIGAIGIMVYYSTVDQSSRKPTAQGQENRTDKLTNYTNNAMGFSFSYPESWGRVINESNPSLFKFQNNQYSLWFHDSNKNYVDADSPLTNIIDLAISESTVTVYLADGKIIEFTENEIHEKSDKWAVVSGDLFGDYPVGLLILTNIENYKVASFTDLLGKDTGTIKDFLVSFRELD